MKNNLDKELYLFFKDEMNIDINENSPNFSLEKDLHIYGDEAFDFLEKFSIKFNINLEDFDFEKYFNNEIDVISLFFKNKFLKNKQSELTINDLKKAIQKKKLI